MGSLFHAEVHDDNDDDDADYDADDNGHCDEGMMSRLMLLMMPSTPFMTVSEDAAFKSGGSKAMNSLMASSAWRQLATVTCT
jgi:hypothetical protein